MVVLHFGFPRRAGSPPEAEGRQARSRGTEGLAACPAVEVRMRRTRTGWWHVRARKRNTRDMRS